ncbi:MAG: IclR family transcriptional regulator [Alicyclobacillus herbarius]|uniref:IclR family transcriptional regulator n=1 Tax=Alicyclobacillus herbarius TaxID=122960 RepID=UPI002357FCA7|nr:IclR family transcriptional regulator [Alicyclobacillus herbarius]MCL6632458.1 IclR family transcriptional regulator [Alicyclobacillus herbarius]
MSNRRDMTGLGIQSVEIAIDILKQIGAADRPLSITEISDLCGMSKSHLHRYLTSLYRTGFLTRDEDLRYSIGPELMSLGMLASSRWDIRRLAKPALLRLRERINETVALSVWTERGPYFLHWEESTRAVNIGIRIGSQVSAVKSAGGKVFLAYLPPAQTEAVRNRELAEYGMDAEAFDAELVEVRRLGYATTVESLLPGILAVACPVFGQGGDVVAAMTVVGILGVLDGSETSPVVRALKAECQRLSRELGG